MICGNCQRDIADYSNFCYFCGARQHYSPSGSPRAYKRLMRSSTDSRIAGVCGGIAEYLDVDSTLVRVIWALAILLPVPVVPAIMGYLLAWLIIPKAPLFLPASSTPQASAPPSGSAGTPQTI
jgi:phage shock protein C